MNTASWATLSQDIRAGKDVSGQAQSFFRQYRVHYVNIPCAGGKDAPKESAAMNPDSCAGAKGRRQIWNVKRMGLAGGFVDGTLA